MPKGKLKLAWISRNANRRSTFRKRRESLLKKVRQLSVLCDLKACAIIYDPNEQKDQKPETWPSEEETKEILRNFRSMPSKNKLDPEAYLRQRVAKSEEQHRRILSDNMETLLTIFLHNCMVGERSVKDLRTVDEAECLVRVIDQKMMAVKDRIKKMIEKGKMVNVDMAEDGRKRDSGMKNLSNFEVNAPMIDDDLFRSCYSNNISDGGLREDVQQPCANVGESSSSVERMMMGADYNIDDGNDDDFFQSFVGNGDGWLDEVIRQSGFNVGESSSLMGSSSDHFLG